MLNKYQRDPAEFKRTVDMLAQADSYELDRLLIWRKPGQGYVYHDLAIAIGIDTHRRGYRAISNDVIALIRAGVDTPEVPEADKPPAIVKPCDGCGGIGDTPKFLRWAKVARDEPVTISYDSRNRPSSLIWVTPKIILDVWYQRWTEDTSIEFRYVENEKGDIHIKYEPIDGPGGTRGFAWLPNQSVDFMEQGGDLSGDMVIDAIDRWSSRDEVNETGEHEAGHTIGAPHTENREDVMFAYSTGRMRARHSLNDMRMKTTRYPKKAIAA